MREEGGVALFSTKTSLCPQPAACKNITALRSYDFRGRYFQHDSFEIL